MDVDAKIVQYYTLFCIYEATNGVRNKLTDQKYGTTATVSKWTNKKGWVDGVGDPCTFGDFYGVTCDGQGRILTIKLNENYMTGTWPAEITLLASDGPRSTGAGNLNELNMSKNVFLFNDNDNSWMQYMGSNFRKFFCFLLLFMFCIFFMELFFAYISPPF